MKTLVTLGLLALSTGTMIGCGGGGSGSGGPPAKPGTVNKTAAANVVSQTSTVQTSLKAGNGPTLSSSVLALGLSGPQQMVSPSLGTATKALTASASQALSSPGPNGGSVDCDATGCTYNMYKSGSTTMNGSVKAATAASATQVTANLTVIQNDVSGVTGNINWAINGQLNFTDTSIDGQLESQGHVAVNSGGVAFNEDFYDLLQYNALILSSGGVAASGSIYAKWGVTVANIPQASQAWEGTATFP